MNHCVDFEARAKSAFRSVNFETFSPSKFRNQANFFYKWQIINCGSSPIVGSYMQKYVAAGCVAGGFVLIAAYLVRFFLWYVHKL